MPWSRRASPFWRAHYSRHRESMVDHPPRCGAQVVDLVHQVFNMKTISNSLGNPEILQISPPVVIRNSILVLCFELNSESTCHFTFSPLYSTKIPIMPLYFYIEALQTLCIYK
jgi:hypothetical protein